MDIQSANKIAAAMLPEARLWLRKSTESLDAEITQTVAACMLDLSTAGVKKIKAKDPLIRQASKLYLKSQFGYGEKPERWAAAYEHLKAALSLSGEYTEVGG